MSRQVVSMTHYGTDGDNKIVPLYGLVAFAKDELVNLVFKGKKLGEYRVDKITIIELRNVTEQDLASFPEAFQNPSIFYNKLEKAYKTGISGDAKITFLTLSSNLEIPKKTRKQESFRTWRYEND